MILSHRHRFVFVKGMKVAGTSFEMAVAPLCDPDDIVTPISPIDELARLPYGVCRNYAFDRATEAEYLTRLAATPPNELATLKQPALVYYNHMPLTEVLAKTKTGLDGYRIVAIERSPYAKVISWANMRVTYGNYRIGGAMRASTDDIRASVDRGFESGQILGARNIDRYRDAAGHLAVQPMRYDTLAADFAAFVRGLGETQIPPLPHAKKGLLSDTLNPREILRPDQIARLNDAFAAEFDAFGYERI